MRLAVDLHMHSCLSPCGDELMSPNNIAGMAMLKQLDLIAVADHNCARNLPALEKTTTAMGIVLLPAMEITTMEEVHLLAYFPTVAAALTFSDYVHEHLMKMPNRPEVLGEQVIMDESDEVIDYEPYWLPNATDLPLHRWVADIRAAGGAPVPAHINRGMNGLIGALGFVPPDDDYACLELSRAFPEPPGIERFRKLYASDAHRLEDMPERTEFLDLPEKSREALFHWILHG